jgi:hypothetical protein
LRVPHRPAADPQGMKPNGVIASEAKQSRAAGATPDEIATAPAAPRNDRFYRDSFFLAFGTFA